MEKTRLHVALLQIRKDLQSEPTAESQLRVCILKLRTTSGRFALTVRVVHLSIPLDNALCFSSAC